VKGNRFSTPIAALFALTTFGACASPNAEGDFVVRGTTARGEFKERLSIDGHDRCSAKSRPDGSGTWVFESVRFDLGDSEVWLLPLHVDVVIPTPQRPRRLYRSDCNRYDVRHWVDRDGVHAVVDLDCLSEDGTLVTGRVSSDECASD
jgi:hypothetical protein